MFDILYLVEMRFKHTTYSICIPTRPHCVITLINRWFIASTQICKRTLCKKVSEFIALNPFGLPVQHLFIFVYPLFCYTMSIDSRHQAVMLHAVLQN